MDVEVEVIELSYQQVMVLAQGARVLAQKMGEEHQAWQAVLRDNPRVVRMKTEIAHVEGLADMLSKDPRPNVVVRVQKTG